MTAWKRTDATFEQEDIQTPSLLLPPPHPSISRCFLEAVEPTNRCIPLNYIPVVLQYSERFCNVSAARGARGWRELGDKWSLEGTSSQRVNLVTSGHSPRPTKQRKRAVRAGTQPLAPPLVTYTEPLFSCGQNPPGVARGFPE